MSVSTTVQILQLKLWLWRREIPLPYVLGIRSSLLGAVKKCGHVGYYTRALSKVVVHLSMCHSH
jgi:hypothetical protein